MLLVSAEQGQRVSEDPWRLGHAWRERVAARGRGVEAPRMRVGWRVRGEDSIAVS